MRPLASAAVAALAAFALAAPAAAFAENRVAPAPITQGAKVTARLTVQSVDMATRHVVLKDSSGQLVSLKAPASFQNLGQLKVGDTLKVTYSRSVEIAITPLGQKAPENIDTMVAARAAKGELPTGAVANHIRVTGAVVGIDAANHQIRLVNPSGGRVYSVDVVTPEGRAALPKLKVGDKVTADIVEGLLLSTERAS